MPHHLTLTSLPLFPLGTVLFPGGVMALQVFEVRYLDMVRKCQRAGAPFGIVSLRSGREVRRAGGPDEQFHDVGTLATITEMQTPQAGLITLSCQGGQRFRILRRTLLQYGLWVADVEHIDDDLAVPIPPDLEPTAAALAKVLEVLRERDPESPASVHPTHSQLADSGWVANRWCELLPVPSELKQQLMELDNPLVRLELVSDLLERTGIAPG